MAQTRGTKRPWTAKLPIDKDTSTHCSKKPKPKQTRMTEWGNLLPPDPEDQEPKAPTESSLSSFHDINPAHQSPALSIANKRGLELIWKI